MAHTPGRGHRRKSNPAKKRRYKRKAAKKKSEAAKRYEKAKRLWDGMSDDAKKLRPELNPDA